MEVKVGEIYQGQVTYKNDHGVFVDIGEFNICLALKENLPDGYYDEAKGGDNVLAEIIRFDDRNRPIASIIEKTDRT